MPSPEPPGTAAHALASSAGVSGSAAGSSLLPSSLLSSTMGREPQAAALPTWTWHQLLNAAVVAVPGSASVTPLPVLGPCTSAGLSCSRAVSLGRWLPCHPHLPQDISWILLPQQ